MVHVIWINLFILELFMNIVLGSASPRRSELLRQLGVDFRILKADCSEEFNPQDTPEQIVYLNHEVIGKPIDSTDAIRLLHQLSGNSHDVFTGVILRNQEKTVRFTVKTSVYFRSLGSSEIEHYVKHFQPLDKAGSYGIQDWIGLIGVQKIEGSYTNVMGLPTQELYLALQNF